MTVKEGMDVALRFTRMNVCNLYAFVMVGLLFGGWTVLSGGVNETEAYDGMRLVMAIGYTVIAVTLLLLSLHFIARTNAVLRFCSEMASSETEAGDGDAKAMFRSTSALWVVFPMVGIIIIVNYIILLYAVEGGLF